jgi:nicotinamidase-related amidase
MSSSVTGSQSADPVVAENRLTPLADASRTTERLLKVRDIDMARIAPTMTNGCCECTARAAAIRTIKKIMISDANTARHDIKHIGARSILLEAFGGAIDTDDALRLIAGAPSPMG